MKQFEEENRQFVAKEGSDDIQIFFYESLTIHLSLGAR
jgi:hypothetical protein